MSTALKLSTVTVVVLVCGCVGTIDTLHSVKGEAPAVRDCEITVTESHSSRVIEKERVSGAFSVTYMASGPFPPKVDVAAYCNGVKVKEMKGISPRNTGDTNLGTLAP
jgi:hypothetical protein